MTDALQYQIEQGIESATLYLSGVVAHTNAIATLAEVCHALPAGVRTLRLDLNATRHVSADAMEAIGVMLCEWREARAGDFRMFYGTPYTSSGAVLSDLARRTRASQRPSTRQVNEALTGIYL